MALLQRMKEADLFKEWESQEDEVRGWLGWGGELDSPVSVLQFHLTQAKLRSNIRIETGRGRKKGGGGGGGREGGKEGGEESRKHAHPCS